jgi:outer membrane protein assembly factor BamD
MKRFFTVFSLFAGILFIASCSKFEKIRRSEDQKVKLEGAYRYYEEKEYYKAGVLLDEVVPLMKGQEGVEKASFTRAMSFFYQKDYIMSAYYFKDLFDTYPRSEYAEESLFMAAKSLYNDSPRYNLDQTSTHDALRALQKFANRYPKSRFITEANQITDELNKKLEVKAFENAKLYYHLGKNNSFQYKSAVVALGTFQRIYANSEFAEEAAFLLIDSQYKLALASITVKQKERYLEAIEFYQNFIDKYPNGKFKKEAEEVYQQSLQKLEKLKSGK